MKILPNLLVLASLTVFNGLKYGKSVVPSNSVVFAKIGPGENYTGKRTDSNVHTVKYKNSICNLDVLYYEETNDYNLEKEKEDTPNFKTIVSILTSFLLSKGASFIFY